MKQLRIASVLLVLTMVSVRASAQDTPAFGVVFGYPAAVGVVWQVSDRIALRPDLYFNWNSTEAQSSSTIGPTFGGQTLTITSLNKTDSNSVGVGIAGLYTVSQKERMRIYVSPRVAYSHASLHNRSETRVEAPPSQLAGITLPAPRDVDTSSHAWTFSGSVGVQYQIGDPFGAFGEVGGAYSSNQPGVALTSDFSSKSFGVRSAVGVIWFF